MRKVLLSVGLLIFLAGVVVVFFPAWIFPDLLHNAIHRLELSDLRLTTLSRGRTSAVFRIDRANGTVMIPEIEMSLGWTLKPIGVKLILHNDELKVSVTGRLSETSNEIGPISILAGSHWRDWTLKSDLKALNVTNGNWEVTCGGGKESCLHHRNFPVAIQSAKVSVRDKTDWKIWVEADPFKVTADGKVDLEKATLDMAVAASAPLSKERFWEIFPKLKSKLVVREGEFWAKGNLRWKDGEISYRNARLTLKEARLRWSKVPVRKLNIEATSSSGRVGKMEWKVSASADRIGKDIRWEDLKLEGDWTYPLRIKVRRLDGKMMNGRIVIRPFDADLESREWGAGMDFEHWEVEKILKATDTTHVQAQGKVSGLLRLRLVDGKPLLDELKIDGDGPGKIIYETAGFAFAKKKIQYLDEFQGLLAAGQEALVRKALEDFDYSVLKLDAKRDGGKDPTVDIFVRGKNQNLANGQVFELHLPIRGNLDSLFGDSLLRQIQEEEE